MKLESLPGVTIFEKADGKKAFTVIPEHVKDINSGDLLRTKDLQMIDVDGSLKPIRMDGLLRHEVGQALSQVYGWKNASVEMPNGKLISTNDLYHIGKRALLSKREGLDLELNQLRKSLTDAGFNQKQIASNEEVLKMTTKRAVFDNHLAGNEIGLEQTVTDLWAIDNGGSIYPVKVDLELVQTFRELNEFLIAHDWFRR